jgi:hypothetical protein
MQMNVQKGNSVFIVTKPLQYFNASNILDNNIRICLIVDYFKSARKIFEKINRSSNLWDETYFFESTFDACRWILKNKKNVRNLYIDGDYGFRKYLFFYRLSLKNVYVYEEGIAAYFANLKDNNLRNNWVIKLFYSFLGHQNYLGGSKYTKGIYIYDIEKHRACIPACNKELKYFKEPFIQHLDNFEDKDLLLTEKTKHIIESVKKRKVILYLATWSLGSNVNSPNYSSDISNMLIHYHDYIKILKPHPHIRQELIEYKEIFDFCITGEDLAEYVIFEVLKEAEELIVIHHGSSALLYFEEQNKLKSIVI